MKNVNVIVFQVCISWDLTNAGQSSFVCCINHLIPLPGVDRLALPGVDGLALPGVDGLALTPGVEAAVAAGKCVAVSSDCLEPRVRALHWNTFFD